MQPVTPKINQYEYFQIYFLWILVYFLCKYMSYMTIFHLSMMLISVFCVCFSVLPFFASLYFKQVNINYLEIHARSSIYIFWPMAYWLINTTRRKPPNFFLKVPYAYENQKSGYMKVCLSCVYNFTLYWWDFLHESGKKQIQMEHESFL